ncbi:MAG: response regulator transcription factor [Bradyrhizobiaceae bacterium]|nr:MAG: response regulator transcription factor [Bradyrhizobiaceae bacterium]
MTVHSESSVATVAVIDDDFGVRDSLNTILRSIGHRVETFETTQAYLSREARADPDCIVLDIRMPGRNGLDFQDDLAKRGDRTSIIILSGYADVPMSVRAMKAGATEFLVKPVRAQDLLDAVELSISRTRSLRLEVQKIANLKAAFEMLTTREREIFGHVAAGAMNKNIASAVGLSEATVKVHRRSVMRKMRARSFAELVRMADQLGYALKHCLAST